MKKIISTILVCVLLVGSIFTLASCGKSVSGTYEADLVVSKVTYEFGMFGKVTCTTDPIVGDTTVKEGKYKIYEAGENEFKIAFTWEGDEAEGDSVSFTTGTEGDVDYIKIAGIQYNKVKK
mgnify:CR=1 FL=1